MKLTKKQIDLIIANTPVHLKGLHRPLVTVLGTFTKYDANWSYRAGWTKDGYLVVTQFDRVL